MLFFIILVILLPIIFIIQDIILHKLDEGTQRIQAGQRELDTGTARYNQGLNKYNKFNNWFIQMFAARKLEEGRRQLEDGRRRLDQGRRELQAGKRKWNIWNRIRYGLLGLCVLSFLFLISSLSYKIFNIFGWIGLSIFVLLSLLWTGLLLWVKRKLPVIAKCIWSIFWYCCYFIPLILF